MVVEAVPKNNRKTTVVGSGVGAEVVSDAVGIGAEVVGDSVGGSDVAVLAVVPPRSS